MSGSASTRLLPVASLSSSANGCVLLQRLDFARCSVGWVVPDRPDRRNLRAERGMPYRTAFLDLTYPDESARPCALQFRIAFTEAPERFGIIQLRHVNPDHQSPLNSSIVRDHVLNRILDVYLRGVALNAIRLVVEDGDTLALFAIEVDIHDYIARGNPYDATHVTTGRGRFSERVAIRTDSVIAGRARVHTAHAKPVPVPKEIAAALR
ncbi:hypothetical protein [Paraburkholderia atlantica]|uniref:hypothetical protein n=1 Tax=Paraburkholderia atlantica TaxID=2654982 RepID=UPI0017B9555A|nr:hypothetical protein [Paraburkholderia atlantica]MBB5420725.1 hypothetical protein [Paraburkholderia atlantica]